MESQLSLENQNLSEDFGSKTNNGTESFPDLQPEPASSGRLLSLDALRGANMLFIMGGAGFFVALAAAFPCSVTQAIADQMEHVSWHGFKHHDMIFPLFLFLAGMSFPFSLGKQRQNGKSTLAIYCKIIIRALLLIILGILHYNKVNFDYAHWRYASVLGHIGVAWAFAAIIFMNTGFKMQTVIATVVLIGYWLLLTLVPSPDVAPKEAFTQEAFQKRVANLLNPDDEIKNNLTMEVCIVGYVDRMYLPGKLYKKIHDPEGILSVIPAIITALLGAMTGGFIRNNMRFSPLKKTGILIVWGAFLVAIGLLWNEVFPMNKNLWNSSFVCFVGGLSILAFALFYWIIDICKIRFWITFFVVIGMNSITIFLAQRVIGFNQARNFFFEDLSKVVPEKAVAWAQYVPESIRQTTENVLANSGDLIESIGYITVCWIFLYFLYRHKIFFKI
ncbi:MAG: DUF5009 domain-containing protein [Planctomycetia bacterium]|nr:DUF5009 domain-containing protein [Planctomycetia bacterium]